MSTTRFLSALLAILALSCLAADARKLQEANPAVPAVEPQTVETTPLPGTPKLASIAVAPNAKATSPVVPTTTAPTPKGKAPGGKVAPAGGKQQGPGAPKQGAAGGAPKAHPAPVPGGAEHKGKPLGREVMQVGTVLRGSSVVGAAPGDANAAGNAIMTVYKNGPVVYIKYIVSVRKLSTAGLPTGATINMAASDATGPAVISFAGAKWVNTTGISTRSGAAPSTDNYLSYATTGVWEDVANIKTASGIALSTA
ncbi:unnamed protein product [Closterium sp. Naga37s-1]|nr:unnamed protein product [Closterium sp. Naga37s-1]